MKNEEVVQNNKKKKKFKLWFLSFDFGDLIAIIIFVLFIITNILSPRYYSVTTGLYN